MSMRERAPTLVWAMLVLGAALVAARVPYTADLSAFLPRRASAAQELLIEQLRAGPATHLLIAEVAGGDAATRAAVSTQLAAQLRADREFAGVANGDAAQLARDRAFLLAHRYVLSPAVVPARFGTEGLHAAIEDTVDALASPAGLLLAPLVTRDPTGEMLALGEALGGPRAPPSRAGAWSSADGTKALMLLHTRAGGADLDGQEAACRALARAFDAAVAAQPPAARTGMKLLVSGPPVFAVAARRTIRAEVLRLSLIGALLVSALLLGVYRSLPALLLTLVPAATGALAGIAAVAAGFGVVHGLTLGFGVTLIGEAVDYGIYLLLQRQEDFVPNVWPTVRLGVLTSICGFAALLPSAFPGLAQLGLYSIAGLAAAALVTRWVLPAWSAHLPPARATAHLADAVARLLERARALRALLLVLPLGAAAILVLHRQALWNTRIESLSPIEPAALALDARLRADAGAPDLRYVVAATAPTAEGALLAAEHLGEYLTPLVDSGVLGGFESPARYLPSQASQERRRASLPAASELRARLAVAVRGLPLAAASLEPFVTEADAARVAAPLTRADLAGTSFGVAVDSLLMHGAAGWSALLPLTSARDGDLAPDVVARVLAAVGSAGVPGAQLLDLKAATDRLYAGYLHEIVTLALAGAALIALLLWISLRSLARTARVLLPLTLAVVTVAGALAMTARGLTLLNVVGMLLIVAVGSNYALFFERSRERPGGRPSPGTLLALVVANLATVLAFGVLASAHVPVLRDLGLTVAPGALLALIGAALLAPAAGRPA